MRLIKFLIFVWIFGSIPSLSAGEAYQSHDSIKHEVERFLESRVAGGEGQVEISVGQLDSRLRLTRCEQPLESFLLPNAREVGRVLVGVRCNGAKRWKLFVRARVERQVELLVAARPLPRGSRLAAGDLKRAVRPESRLSTGYIVQQSDIVGKILSRTVSAGSVITHNHLDNPRAVKRGERVSIVAEMDGLSISMEGTALADGAVGEVIRVKNRSSQRQIDAEVVSGGVVRVRM